MMKELQAIIEQAKRTEYSYWKIDLANAHAKSPLTNKQIYELNDELATNVKKLEEMKMAFLEKYNRLN